MGCRRREAGCWIWIWIVWWWWCCVGRLLHGRQLPRPRRRMRRRRRGGGRREACAGGGGRARQPQRQPRGKLRCVRAALRRVAASAATRYVRPSAQGSLLPRTARQRRKATRRRWQPNAYEESCCCRRRCHWTCRLVSRNLLLPIALSGSLIPLSPFRCCGASCCCCCCCGSSQRASSPTSRTPQHPTRPPPAPALSAMQLGSPHAARQPSTRTSPHGGRHRSRPLTAAALWGLPVAQSLSLCVRWCVGLRWQQLQQRPSAGSQAAPATPSFPAARWRRALWGPV